MVSPTRPVPSLLQLAATSVVRVTPLILTIPVFWSYVYSLDGISTMRSTSFSMVLPSGVVYTTLILSKTSFEVFNALRL